MTEHFDDVQEQVFELLSATEQVGLPDNPAENVKTMPSSISTLFAVTALAKVTLPAPVALDPPATWILPTENDEPVTVAPSQNLTPTNEYELPAGTVIVALAP